MVGAAGDDRRDLRRQRRSRSPAQVLPPSRVRNSCQVPAICAEHVRAARVVAGDAQARMAARAAAAAVCVQVAPRSSDEPRSCRRAQRVDVPRRRRSLPPALSGRLPKRALARSLVVRPASHDCLMPSASPMKRWPTSVGSTPTTRPGAGEGHRRVRRALVAAAATGSRASRRAVVVGQDRRRPRADDRPVARRRRAGSPPRSGPRRARPRRRRAATL